MNAWTRASWIGTLLGVLLSGSCGDVQSELASDPATPVAEAALRAAEFKNVDDFVVWTRIRKSEPGPLWLVAKREFRGVRVCLATQSQGLTRVTSLRVPRDWAGSGRSDEPSAERRALPPGTESDAWTAALILMKYRLHVKSVDEYGLSPRMEDPRVGITVIASSVDARGGYWAIDLRRGREILVRDQYAMNPRAFDGIVSPADTVGAALLDLVSSHVIADGGLDADVEQVSDDGPQVTSEHLALLSTQSPDSHDLGLARASVALAFIMDEYRDAQAYDNLADRLTSMCLTSLELRREVALLGDLRRELVIPKSPDHYEIISRELESNSARVAFIRKAMLSWRMVDAKAASAGLRTLADVYRQSSSAREDVLRVLVND
jgi:hypothetical protein